MNTFPTISTGPNFKFEDEKNPDAVAIASTASGYPVLNKLLTFDGRGFFFEHAYVSQASKEAIIAFYEANKDIPFLWTNEQDNVEYEVVFLGPPKCKTEDDRTFWRVSLSLMQSS